MKLNITTLLSAALMALPAFACAQQAAEDQAPAQTQAAPQTQAMADEIIATVDGEEITRAEVEERATQIVYQQIQSLGQGAQGSLGEEQMNMLRQQARGQAIQSVINGILLEQAQEESDVTVDQALVDEKLAEVEEMLSQQGMDLERYLAMQNMSEESLREEIRKSLRLEQILEERTGELTPTDEEMKAYFEENKERFAQPPTVTTSHILFAFPGDPRDPNNQPPSDEVKAEKRQQAEQVLEKARAGEDFAELAREHSEGPSADRGGDIGPQPKGNLAPAYEEAAYQLEPGEISDIVETQFGYHIIKLREKSEGEAPDYEEVKQYIEQGLTQQKFGEAMQAYLEELRQEADIEIKQSALAQQMPTQAPGGMSLAPSASE